MTERTRQRPTAPSPDDAGEPLIRAAVYVLWRPSLARVEVAIVYRPGYDDWSLPKGKLARLRGYAGL